jgi:hypothetical protein
VDRVLTATFPRGSTWWIALDGHDDLGTGVFVEVFTGGYLIAGVTNHINSGEVWVVARLDILMNGEVSVEVDDVDATGDCFLP